MKRILAAIFTLGLTFSLFALSSSSEYEDGGALIAKSNQLPRGLFSKAKGYLPGDSISVSNPDNGRMVQVLNLGKLDDSSDNALLISQEAAEQLGLNERSALKVQLAKRSGSYDQSSSGNALLSAVRTTEESDFEQDKQDVQRPSPAERAGRSEPEEKDIEEEEPPVIKPEEIQEEPVDEVEKEDPVEENEPAEEETPVEEVEPVEEEEPVEEVEPVEEETPVEEVEPVEEEEPVEEVEPVEEETPVEEVEPVEEETPVEEVEPVEEESSVEEVEPIEEEEPVEEVEPVE